MDKSIYSIPNLLSLLRIALVPVLALAAAFNQADLFLLVLAISLLSDLLDGYFARKLHQVTELGARLDSWADMATYAMMIIGLYLIWPIILLTALLSNGATLSYVLPVLSLCIVLVAFQVTTLGEPNCRSVNSSAFYLLILADNQMFFRLVIVFMCCCN